MNLNRDQDLETENTSEASQKQKQISEEDTTETESLLPKDEENLSQQQEQQQNPDELDEIPLKQMQYDQVFKKSLDLLKPALNMTFNFLFIHVQRSSNLFMIQTLNDTVLYAAVGMANFLYFCCGQYLIQRLQLAIGVHMSRAVGKNDQALLTNYYNKGLVVSYFFFALYAVIIYYCSSILIFMGQNEELAIQTHYFCLRILFAEFLAVFSNLNAVYLNAHLIYFQTMVIKAITVGTNIIICFMLIGGYGFDALIISLNICFIIEFLAFQFYLKKIDKYPTYTTHNLFTNMYSYVEEIISIAAPDQLIIFGFQINTAILGLVATVDAMAQHFAINDFQVYYQTFCAGLTSVTYNLFSISVGKGHAQKTINTFHLSYILSTIYGVIVILILLCLQGFIAGLYFEEKEQQDTFKNLIIIVLFMIIFQTTIRLLNAAGKCLGRAKVVGILSILQCYAVGVPLSLLFVFYFDYGVYGVWIAWVFSMLFSFVSVNMVLYKTDFKKEISEIQQKLKTD